MRADFYEKGPGDCEPPDYPEVDSLAFSMSMYTVPRLIDEQGTCYTCGAEAFDGAVLCYDCDDQMNERTYVSHEVGFMPFTKHRLPADRELVTK